MRIKNKFILICLTLCLIFCFVENVEAVEFSDTNQSDWFYSNVNFSLWNLLLFLFKLPKFSVRAWWFGHKSWRLSSLLFKQSPSIWCTWSGTNPVYGFTSFQPHTSQAELCFSKRYLLICLLISLAPFLPSWRPAFHSSIYFLYW